MPGNETIVNYHSTQTHSRFRLLHVLELLFYNLETMGHALLELSESSDPQLFLDLGKLLLLLVEFLTYLLDFILKLEGTKEWKEITH